MLTAIANIASLSTFFVIFAIAASITGILHVF